MREANRILPLTARHSLGGVHKDSAAPRRLPVPILDVFQPEHDQRGPWLADADARQAHGFGPSICGSNLVSETCSSTVRPLLKRICPRNAPSKVRMPVSIAVT